MNEPSMKIFLSYHNDSERISSSILTPIHVGRKIASSNMVQRLQDMIGDDTGDNISEKNESFCELTAQYWAWKNTCDDYVGFFHYRRHLSFNDHNKKENKWGLLDFPFVTDDYLAQAGLIDDTIKKKMRESDIVTVKKWDVREAGSKNNFDHYENSSPHLHIDDYKKALELVIQKYPDYKEDVEYYNDDHLGYYTNIFVAKREVFEDYCSFLFDVLFDLEKALDISNYNDQEKRVFGYISEWLFGIYITHLIRTASLKKIELPRTIVSCTTLDPDYINYCSSSDDAYVRHLGVFLTSVKRNKGNENIRYWILSNNISEKNKKLLKAISSKDFEIVLVDCNYDMMDNLERTLYTNPHLSLATYTRLLIAHYLPSQVRKILYLDCDMICRDSLLELYDTHMKDCCVLGVKDILCETNIERLGIDKYINAGVMVINLEYWRNHSVQKQFIDYVDANIDNKKTLFYHDQDVINAILKDKICYVDSKWNAQTSSYPGCYEQNEIGNSSVIVHFISERKPWIKGSDSPFAYEYEKYLKLSLWSGQPLHIHVRRTLKTNVKNHIKSISSKMVKNFGCNIITHYIVKFDARCGNYDSLISYYDECHMSNSKYLKDTVKIIRPYAERGNVHAMTRMARAYKDGVIGRDLKESFRWFSKVSKSGVYWITEEFGEILPEMYDDSYSIDDPDYHSQLVRAIRPYAERGNVHAMTRMARAYKDGHGVQEDENKFLKWSENSLDNIK